MASEEHRALSFFLKEVHSSLREATNKMGAQTAWQEHCSNKDLLRAYARCMEKLATTHWTENCSNDPNTPTSRIEWTANLCYEYFLRKTYLQYKDKDEYIASKIGLILDIENSFSEPIRLLDVGSCYNPFQSYDCLDVVALDLCPANDSVYECDFLEVPIALETTVLNGKIMQLQESSFDVITFCFLLEYIPTSGLRVKACEKAYILLKPGGLLIITTPDSKHVGANSKIMKCWQYTLAMMGFTRIRYEKLKHMHSMGFRKALHSEIAKRWAMIHKEPYMEYAIYIPQDSQKNIRCEYDFSELKSFEINCEDFKELPFCNNL